MFHYQDRKVMVTVVPPIILCGRETFISLGRSDVNIVDILEQEAEEVHNLVPPDTG
jgi:hypothetical protein